MAPPPSTVVSPFVSLIVRIFTFVCLLISLILLTTATGTTSNADYGNIKVKFKDFKAFRYLCAAIVVGLVYTLVQTALAVIHLSSGNRFGGDGLVYVEFFGDKVATLVVATGGAASFGMTQDFKNLIDVEGLGITHFIRTTDAAASLCLLGSLFLVVSSIFSSFALPKRP